MIDLRNLNFDCLSRVVYIENTPMFVQIAESLGIRSIIYTDYKSTCAKLSALGLKSF
jgi:putative hydrolase of the HAD superfamily